MDQFVVVTNCAGCCAAETSGGAGFWRCEIPMLDIQFSAKFRAPPFQPNGVCLDGR